MRLLLDTHDLPLAARRSPDGWAQRSRNRSKTRPTIFSCRRPARGRSPSRPSSAGSICQTTLGGTCPTACGPSGPFHFRWSTVTRWRSATFHPFTGTPSTGSWWHRPVTWDCGWSPPTHRIRALRRGDLADLTCSGGEVEVPWLRSPQPALREGHLVARSRCVRNMSLMASGDRGLLQIAADSTRMKSWLRSRSATSQGKPAMCWPRTRRRPGDRCRNICDIS